MITALIMAAGRAERFGTCKSIADCRGRPLWQHVLQALQAQSQIRVVVVTGCYHQELLDSVIGEAIQPPIFFHSTKWGGGVGNSIADAVRQFAPKSDGIMICMADQVALTADDLERMLTVFDGQASIAAHYQGRFGVPALFAPRDFPALQTLSGDVGAKRVLWAASEEGRLRLVDMPNAAVDIDTPEQLSAYRAAH